MQRVTSLLVTSAYHMCVLLVGRSAISKSLFGKARRRYDKRGTASPLAVPSARTFCHTARDRKETLRTPTFSCVLNSLSQKMMIDDT